MLLTHAPLNIFQIFYDVHFVVDWRSYSAHYPPWWVGCWRPRSGHRLSPWALEIYRGTLGGSGFISGKLLGHSEVRISILLCSYICGSWPGGS